MLLSGKEYEVDSEPILELATISYPSAYDCEYITITQELSIHVVISDRKI